MSNQEESRSEANKVARARWAVDAVEVVAVVETEETTVAA